MQRFQRGPQFADVVSEVAQEYCWKDDPRCPSCPLVDYCLTAQELQIARLAAEGLSNKEIAERLYLSPRTIGSHLYKIFPKAGVSSRTELARLILTQDPG